MAQTRDGAIRCAAQKTGLSEAEYRLKLASGQKWCTKCKAWHMRSDFRPDVSRWDGLSASCKDGRSAAHKQKYVKRARPSPGRRFTEARDDDKVQARSRVNYLIDIKLLPDPNNVACVDCGHDTSKSPEQLRHEYDHHLGYGAAHHEHVEAVCSRCHHRRAEERKETWWLRGKD